MQDPILDLWNNLATEGDPIILPEVVSFECNQKTPFLKGLYENPNVLGSRARFMCVRVSVNTYSGEELLDETVGVLNFFQITDVVWAYSLSEGGSHATFRNAMAVGRHSVELVQRLLKGEDSEVATVSDADDETLIVKMKPIEFLN